MTPGALEPSQEVWEPPFLDTVMLTFFWVTFGFFLLQAIPSNHMGEAPFTFSFEADLKVTKNLKLDWIRESLGLDGLPRSRVRRIPNQGLSRSGKRPMILVTRKSLRVLLARFALCALCFVLCAMRFARTARAFCAPNFHPVKDRPPNDPLCGRFQANLIKEPFDGYLSQPGFQK